MKQKDDKYTSELFGNRPVRPRKPNAMTVAERVRKHRLKLKSIQTYQKTECVQVEYSLHVTNINSSKAD